MGGREVQAVRPMQDWERANPRSQGGGSLKVGPWENPPKPPPGVQSRDLVDMDALHKASPDLYSDPAKGSPYDSAYGKGGKVRSYCKSKVISSRNC
jgi:hypothetical protein